MGQSPLHEELIKRQVAKSQELMKTEMPDVASKVSVEPTGWLGNLLDSSQRFITGRAEKAAATANSLTGNVSYNPDVMQGMNQETTDSILAHELTHSRQTLAKPWYKRISDLYTQPNLPYGQTPHEMEAYNEEIARAQRLGLTPPDTPNFSDEGFHRNQDIPLRRGK